MEPLLVDVRTAAKLLGCGKTSLYVLLRAEKIEARRIGRKTLITMSSLKALAGSDGEQA